ncbi:Matrix metalloproteinase-27 [Trichinella spiralis]|uniref:Matrix metalloproteinase-27 n=1 Tax=Trichinella spiralis TaxID=6334 RepID=A0ABR3KU98_TRISP
MTAIRPSGPIKQLVIGQRQGFECENVRSYVPIDPETQLLSMVRCWCRPSNGVQSTSTGYRKEPANQKQTTVEPDDDNDAQTSDPAVNVLLSWLTVRNFILFIYIYSVTLLSAIWLFYSLSIVRTTDSPDNSSIVVVAVVVVDVVLLKAKEKQALERKLKEEACCCQS